LFCWSVYVFILSALNFMVASLLMRKGDKMVCNEQGTEVLFKSCGSGTLFYVFHNFTTMQTAAVVRAIFVKTVKKSDPKRMHANQNIEMASP